MTTLSNEVTFRHSGDENQKNSRSPGKSALLRGAGVWISQPRGCGWENLCWARLPVGAPTSPPTLPSGGWILSLSKPEVREFPPSKVMMLRVDLEDGSGRAQDHGSAHCCMMVGKLQISRLRGVVVWISQPYGCDCENSCRARLPAGAPSSLSTTAKQWANPGLADGQSENRAGFSPLATHQWALESRGLELLPKDIHG